jgi:hypothetical protein
MSRWRQAWLALVLVAGCALWGGCASTSTDGDTQRELTGKGWRAVVLPPYGGRLIAFEDSAGRNALYRGTAADLPPPQPADDLFWRHREVGGMVTWVAPQKQWYNQQSAVPGRRGKVWPPDPYLAFGRATIAESANDGLALTLPHSPVSGVTMTRRYKPAGARLLVESTLHNTSTTPISWGIWHNTRVPAGAWIAVALGKGADISFAPASATKRAPSIAKPKGLLLIRHDGAWGGKISVSAAAGYIWAFSASSGLEVAFQPVPAGAVAPGQAPVEIYLGAAYAELETHGRYTRLAPGDRMRERAHLRHVPAPKTFDVAGITALAQQFPRDHD